jgi:hypothetical protein
MTEIWKGRKHGLYPLMPYLPESLAQPMLEDKTVRDLIEGKDNFENVFTNMKSVEHLKTFWLNIAKGIAVYEFISSTFIGDKDPLTAHTDLIALMMQPKNFEAINKNIDLSLLYVDDWEAARLKVNIVTAAISAVAREYSSDEYVGIGPQGSLTNGKLISLSEIKEKDLINMDNQETGLKGALRQLVVSRFVGDVKDVMKIIDKIKKTSSGGQSNICFSMTEFKALFGMDYLDRVWKNREKRKKVVANRQL